MIAPADANGSDVEAVNRRVGLLVAVTGVALFALMGLLGLGMRLTQANQLGLSDEWFYRIMTLHGAGMLVAALLALMGGLWYVLRETVALSVPRMVASYLLIVAGALTVLVSVMIGGFATGWTFLWPLPYYPLNMWPEWAAVVFLLGMVLVGTGFQVYCIDLLSKLSERHGGLAGAFGVNFLKGNDEDPPAPQEIAAAVISLVGLIALTAGTVILVALLGRAIDPQIEIDALWAKNMTFFFGHTVANLIIYLGAGMIYVLLPRFAGRPWKTTKPIVIGWLFTMLLVLTAFGHHLYMDFVQPKFATVIATIASFGAALPVAVVTIYTGMMLVWGSRFRWTLASTLLYLGFAGWAIGGAGAVIDSVIPANFKLHNTLWVPAHFHTYMMMGAIMWVFAFTVWLLEKAAGRPASRLAGIASPLLMVIGGYGLVGAWYVSGALGVPRRYSQQLGQGDEYSLVASVFVIVFALGLLVLLAELGRLGLSAWRRRGQRSMQVMAGGSPELDAGAATSDRKYNEPERVAPIVSEVEFIVTSAIATLALFSIFPPLISASEASVQWHHVDHAAQFFLGLMVAMILMSVPSVWRSVSRTPQTAALVAVIVAPAAAMMAMVPKLYSGLEANVALHGLYHLVFLVLGFVTGAAAAKFGRTTAWTLGILSASMMLLFAAGVSGS